MILSSIVVTVSMMTYFAWFYNYFYTKAPIASTNRNNASRINLGKLNNEIIVNNLGTHAIYAIKILTKQGIESFVLDFMVFKLLTIV